MSPKRSHSPGSMNPDRAPGREHGRRRPRKGAGPGTAASPSSCGVRGRRSLAASPARPGVGGGGHTLESALPISAQGRLWARAFLAPAPPPRLPAPRRGWGRRAGPLNPGRARGRLPALALGSGEAARRPGGALSWPGAGAARQRRWVRWVRWVRWGAQLLGGHARARAHTHIHTCAHAHARSHTPHCLAAPWTCSSHPCQRQKAELGSCYLLSQRLWESNISQCSPNDTLPLHRWSCQGPGRTLHS